MKKYFLYILITVLAIKANAQDGFKPSEKGTQYKILTNNTGNKIKIGDVITFHVIQKTDKDSVLASSYQTGRPAQAQVQATGDLMDIFQLLALNDSVLVKVPTDTIFKTQEDHRPPFFPKGSKLLILIKIIKVQTLTEAMADRDKAMAAEKEQEAKLQAEEGTILDKYIKDHKLELTTTASGLKYKITKLGSKPKPLTGDTVTVNYVVHTLSGKVVDTSIESIAKAAGLEQPGRVYDPLTFVLGAPGIISGWGEGLQLINGGGKAMLITPSKLAYGANASGPDIKPFSTLLFDIELLKVSRVKTIALSTKPAASARKPVSKKAPVKKPAATKKK